MAENRIPPSVLALPIATFLTGKNMDFDIRRLTQFSPLEKGDKYHLLYTVVLLGS